ncbi:sensor domain-containing diguanylate cyclase [Pelotomaculum propionicicum]|uniref:sensor domain-containing diguanylate cyclase n=1 Tax=Pelotomaculum propionicicum TaxID=258475 RepID=UPI003B7E464B
MFQSLFQYLLLQNNDIVLLIGHDGRIVDANDTAASAYEYDREELLAGNFEDLCAPDTAFDISDALKESAGQALKIKTSQRGKSGRVFPVEIIARSARIDDEEMLFCVVSDLTKTGAAGKGRKKDKKYEELKASYEEIKTAYEELAKTTYESFNDISGLVLSKRKEEQARKRAELLSNTDYLTGTLNRRAFEKQLDAEINRARRENLPLGVILTDIDFFKNINDTHGHQLGDEVLKKMAEFLMQQCRSYDFVGRYGGEEFIICLPGASLEDAYKKACRLCAAVPKLEVPGLDNIKITASFGVSSLKSADRENIDTIFKRADQALYKAKSEGRNCVRMEE